MRARNECVTAIVFLHNWEAFVTYIAEMEGKIEKLKAFLGPTRATRT